MALPQATISGLTRTLFYLSNVCIQYVKLVCYIEMITFFLLCKLIKPVYNQLMSLVYPIYEIPFSQNNLMSFIY